MKKRIIFLFLFMVLVAVLVLKVTKCNDKFIPKSEGKVTDVLFGRITDDKGRAIENTAVIEIEISGQDGEITEKIVAYTGKNGWYKIDKGKNQEISYKVKAPLHRSKTGKARIVEQSQLDFKLSTNTADLLILLPIVAGLIMGILFIIGFGKEKGITRCYAVCVALIWSAVISILTCYYAAMYKIDTLYLFNDNLAVPIFVPVFAFIGVVAYATYSMKFNFRQFFGGNATDEVRQKILMSIAHRILIAPYIAMIAYLVLLKNIESSRTIAFFSFFTGLYMPVIMETLNQAGLKLLPEKVKQKVTKREAEA